MSGADAVPWSGSAQVLPPPESDRQPARETYDALVDLTPANRTPQLAYALVKFAFRITHLGCRPDFAEPLRFDHRPEDASPRLVPGSDFHLMKHATDLAVEGSIFAPGGRATSQVDACIDVGPYRKLVRGIGDRRVHWRGNGRVDFSAPEPFEKIPLSWDRAYGGIDWRLTVPEDDPQYGAYLTEADHPGIYPRNPFGRGYVVSPEDPREPVRLPNLEDPEDLLTPDRFLVRDPRLWYRQPVPCNLGWTHPIMWPRMMYFLAGMDAWYPAPEDRSLPEVQRGWLEPGYRQRRLADPAQGIHPRFVQEAPHGLTVPGLRGDEEVLLWNLHPELPEIRFRLPWEIPPALSFFMDGTSYPVQPRLHHIVFRPESRTLFTVWAAAHPTPRTYLPGIHREIRLALQVQGDTPIPYLTPQTIRDQIAQAQAASQTPPPEAKP
jgi:hypothetical protein